MHPDSHVLVEESRQALQGIRRALIELYGMVGADPHTPQVISRRYGINRNLAWKLSRVISESDPFAALNHLPGTQGMELALRAFGKAGATSETLESVRAAMRTLDEVMQEHAGDREHLELTLESMGLFQHDSTAESGRELAFRGNSMVWGVQVQTRWSAAFFGPGKDSDKMDFVAITGLLGFRRLRPSVQWRLQRHRLFADKGGVLRPEQTMEEIETKGPNDIPLQIREFCSANTPDLVVVDTQEGREVMLPAGPVGNLGAFDIFTGGIHRGLSRYRTAEETMCSRATAVTLPAESLIFDLIVHRDYGMPARPEVILNGFPFGQIGDPRATSHRLPFSDEMVELAGSPPAVSTPAVPRLTRIMERIFARMGWKGSDFRGMRLQLAYPPMSSVVVVQWPLPEAPKN